VTPRKPPGSLLDLLPRPRTEAWDALPQWLQAEVDVIRRAGGYKPVTPGDLESFHKIVRDLAQEQRVLASEIREALQRAATSNANTAKAVATLEKEQAANRLWVTDHEKRLDAHDVVIGHHAKKHVEHDKKHEQHEQHITGLHSKIVVLEETVLTTTKRAPQKRGKARR
jgi:hypothetical protein